MTLRTSPSRVRALAAAARSTAGSTCGTSARSREPADRVRHGAASPPTPVVLVLTNGGPVAIDGLIDGADAIVEAFNPDAGVECVAVGKTHETSSRAPCLVALVDGHGKLVYFAKIQG